MIVRNDELIHSRHSEALVAMEVLLHGNPETIQVSH
jgi:hypothetical protein